MDYIMALAGHARQSTTEHYLDGHEQKLPVAVSADLAINNVDLDNISWDLSLLPPELVKLIDEPDDA